MMSLENSVSFSSQSCALFHFFFLDWERVLKTGGSLQVRSQTWWAGSSFSALFYLFFPSFLLPAPSSASLHRPGRHV